MNPWGMDVSPDGQTAVSTAASGEVQLWHINPAWWRERACAIAGRNLTQTEWAQYLSGEDYHAHLHAVARRGVIVASCHGEPKGPNRATFRLGRRTFELHLYAVPLLTHPEEIGKERLGLRDPVVVQCRAPGVVVKIGSLGKGNHQPEIALDFDR